MLTVHFAFLFIPVFGFGYMLFRDEETSGNALSFARLIPMLLFILYSGYILSLGLEQSIHYFNDIGHKQGLVTFVLPGVGFALAAFPEPLAELIPEPKIPVRAIGWFMIAAVTMRHMVMMG